MLQKNRGAKRRNSDENVERGIDEHFPDFTRHNRKEILVDGANLEDFVKAEFYRVGKRNGRIGQLFWSAAQRKYTKADTVQGPDPLTVQNKEQSLGDDMVEVLRAFNNRAPDSRNKELFLSWLSDGRKVNQREYVAMLRTLQKWQAPTSRLYVPLRVAFMKFIMRHGLHTAHANATEHLKDQWDAALTLAYTGMFAEHIPVATFVQMYKDLLPLTNTDPVMIEKIINCSGTWADVKDEVQAVTSRSQPGKKTIGFVSTAIVSSLMGTFMAEQVQAACSGNAPTLKMCSEVHEEVQQQGAALQASLLLPPLREVMVCYRDLEYKVNVTNVAQESQTVLAAATRTLALGTEEGDLVPLWFEHDVFGDVPARKCAVEPLVYAEALVARRSCNEMLRQTNWETFEDLAVLLKSNKLILSQLDGNIRVEMGLVEALAGGKATELAFKKVLASLPAGNKPVEFSAVRSVLSEFHRTKLHSHPQAESDFH